MSEHSTINVYVKLIEKKPKITKIVQESYVLARITSLVSALFIIYMKLRLSISFKISSRNCKNQKNAYQIKYDVYRVHSDNRN